MTRTSRLAYLSIATAALLSARSADAQDSGRVSVRRPDGNRRAPQAPRDREDDWADVAARVPGFAGLYRHGDTLIIVLVDTTRLAAADSAAAPTMGGRRAEFPYVRAQPARYNYRQVREWKRLVVIAAADWPMTNWGIDIVRNAVAVDVATAGEVAPLRERLLQLGIPAGALIIDVRPPDRDFTPRDEEPRESGFANVLPNEWLHLAKPHTVPSARITPTLRLHR